MGQRLVIKTLDLVEEVKFLTSNFTYNKLYHYANYFECSVFDGKLHIQAPLIIGEAVGTGMVESVIDCQHDEDVVFSVPIVQMVDAMKPFKGIHQDVQGYVDVDVTTVSIHSRDEVVRVPRVTVEIPTQIKATFNEAKELMSTQGVIVNIDPVSEAVKTIGKTLTTTTVDYAYYALYFHETGVYSFNGITLSVDSSKTEELEPVKGLFVPAYLQKQLAIMDSIWVMTKMTTDANHVLLSRGSRSVLFHEWFSKDKYPIDALVQLSHSEGTPLPFETTLDAIKKVAQLSKVVVIDGEEGVIKDTRGKIAIRVDLPKLPPVMYHTSGLPKATEYKNFESIEIANGAVTSLLFRGQDAIKLIAPTVE